MSERWFIYALGSGWGHLNRALALARVAAQRQSIHLFTNSPYAEKLRAEISVAGLTLHTLPQHSSLAESRQAIQSRLKSIDYSTLVVDTFPRGLIGELAGLIPQQPEVCHVLVHRDINPDYIKNKSIASFVKQHYNGILIPGDPSPPLAHLPQVQITAPWLSRSAHELPNPDTFREQWKIPTDRPFVLVCGAGQPAELAFFGQLTTDLTAAFPAVTVRCLSATCPPNCNPQYWISHWPGLELLQLADVVVGSGGYNLVHECAALQVPLIAFALPRKYDRQKLRIQACAGHLVQTAKEAIAVLDALLSANPHNLNPHKPEPNYTNGAIAAVSHIKTWQQNPLK